MIFGHGIDLQEISAVKKAYDRNPRFAKKVLTPKEWERFESLSGERQISFLAGRWAGKEAFSKAWGTGIGAVSFKDIEILNNDKELPWLLSRLLKEMSLSPFLIVVILFRQVSF